MAKEDSSVTQDIERHFLSQTVRLSDGSEGHVFSRVANKNNLQQFVYNCHLCGVANLTSERALQTHISGKKHQQKLSQPHIDVHIFRAPLTAKPKIQMNIAPGEPVPPGFEDEVKVPSIIQTYLTEYKDGALIGIEYCVELTIDGKDPSYICLLCDKRGDQRTIFGHWISYNHRLKYLEKHFPTVVKELIPFRYNPEAKTIMPRLIEGVIQAIEQHHGRLAPSVCENNDFKRKRNIILQEIIAEKHFDEKTGPNFINAIDRTLVENKKQVQDPSPPRVRAPSKRADHMISLTRKDRNSLDDISSDSDTSFNRNIEEDLKCHAKLDDKKNKSKGKNIHSSVFRPRVQRSPPFDETHKIAEKKKVNLPTPKELSLQASEIAQERYKWEKYRCMLEIAVHDLDKQFKNYEKNPEKHPLYPEEWKQFWNRRYKELQAEKKDANKYDFKPEWVTFWTKRMKDIYQEEIDKKKNELRRRLNLPEDGEEQTDELKEKYKIRTIPRKPLNESKSSNLSNESSTVIDISDDELDLSSKRVSKSTSSHISRARRRKSRTRSISPSLSSLSDDFSDKQSSGKSKVSKHRNGRSRSRSHSHTHTVARHRDHSHERTHRSRSPLHIRATGYSHLSSAAQNEYYILRPHITQPGGITRLTSHVGYVPRYYAPPHQTYRAINPYKYVKYEDDLVGKSSPKEKEKSVEAEDNGPLTVVAVLRLLTALEDHLGSLGPKVIDLLSKALALEKIKANSADDMLMSDDHCVFFETVKEKLKGQLIAEVFDSNKVKTVKRAIKNIAGIIHQANEKNIEKQKQGEQEAKENGKDDAKNSKSPLNKNLLCDLPINRQIISSKLAAALVLQKRTDITTDEMNKLIYVLILMVKLSKERDMAITVRDLLIELGIIDPPQTIEGEEEYIRESHDEYNAEVVYEERKESEEVNEPADEEEDTNTQSGVADLESLTDSDLQTLLQNFKHLSSEEQHHLITHLKKLEMTNPVRVEKLRKSVNISSLTEVQNSSDIRNFDNGKKKLETNKNDSLSKKRYNMFSDDEDDDRKLQKMIDSEDDEDDYNFDDVVKAASKNVARKNTDESTQHSLKLANEVFPSQSSILAHSFRGDSVPRSLRDNENQIEDSSNMSKTSSIASNSTTNLGISLVDTQNLIANLMGSLQKSKNLSLQNQQQSQPIPTTSQQQQNQQKLQNRQINNSKEDLPRNINAMSYYQQQSSIMQQQFDSNNMFIHQQAIDMLNLNNASNESNNNAHSMNSLSNINMFYGNNNMQDYCIQNYSNQSQSLENFNSYNSAATYNQHVQQHNVGYPDFANPRHHQYR
ncbi:uncharacterized protein CG7065-like isoform X2 [Condylostylus longicornis]|nr:uncharacterized protein CG7065-like isoform X2 [Condylostylus longicornis]